MKQYTVEEDGNVIRPNKDTLGSLSMSIRKHYIKPLIAIREAKACHSCGGCIKWETKRYTLPFDLEDDVIRNIRLKHYMDSTDFEIACCEECFVSKVKGKNPNSVEMVSMKFGLSVEDSLKYIHSRNKSPFYATNHDSEESYRNHQNAYYGLSEEEKLAIIDKQNVGREAYRENFINEHGYSEWAFKNRDSSSIAHFKAKYGDDWEVKFKEKTSKTTKPKPVDPTVEEMSDWLEGWYGIVTEEDFCREFKNRTSGMDEFEIEFYIQKAARFKGVYTKHNTYTLFSMAKFGILDLHEKMGVEKNEKIQRIIGFDKKTSKQVAEDGFFFRSHIEYKLYTRIKDLCTVIGVNKKYPDQNKGIRGSKFYDFCIEYLGDVRYIEVLGLDDDEYMENVRNKVERWGSVTVRMSGIKRMVEDMKNGRDLQNEYK